MTAIAIGPVSTDGSTLRCPVSYGGPLRRFFSGEPFVADYDVDLADVPESVAVIPVLAHVCPVAWANGATVRAPAVDAEFLDSLRAVGNELVDMYPAFMEGGRIEVGDAVENEAPRGRRTEPLEASRADGGTGAADVADGHVPPDATDAAVLFSGGVDSLATYVRHREESPALVSVQGWVLKRDQPERWARVWRAVERFADARGVESHAISSNMLEFLHTPMLQAHYKRHVDGAWYSSVGHGLGLLGLCAPLAFARGYGTVYMAATHTEAFDEPWGSHPRIDDRVRWTGTRAAHDGYDLSRQEKLELIADYVRDGEEDLTLRTCIYSDDGDNCGQCEKCYRTAAGVVLAGLDPNEFGYDVDGETFGEIRRALESGRFALGEDERFMWQDIRRHVPDEGDYPWPEAEAFFDWLRAADLDELVDRGGIPLGDRVVRAGMRHTPYPVYDRVYSLYDRVRTTADR
ncbi:MAG TPA: hypothetical protein VKA37_11330 [Halobacteriales archaeon]|nr:hypothetical protein [Halobacteriales archaeon]